MSLTSHRCCLATGTAAAASEQKKFQDEFTRMLRQEEDQLKEAVLREEDGARVWHEYARLVDEWTTNVQPAAQAHSSAVSDPALDESSKAILAEPTRSTSQPSPLLAECWSRLHSGHWQSVPLVWRQLYERCGVLDALRLSSSSRARSSVVDLTAALRAIDLALMMGSDETTFTRHAHAIVADIEAELMSCDTMHTGIDGTVTSGNSKRPRSAVAHDDAGQDEQATELGAKEPPVKKTSTVSLAPLPTVSASSSFPSLPSPPALAPVPHLPTSSFARPLLRESLPSLERFRHLASLDEPFILTNSLAHWPALEASGPREWTRDYLRRAAGRRTVPVEIGANYLAEEWTQQLMTIDELIEQHMGDECAATVTHGKGANLVSPSTRIGYLAQHALFSQVPSLRRDIVVPDYCLVVGSSDPVLNAWIGPAGTISPLHQDPTRNLLAQVRGRKYVRLYDDRDAESLYPNTVGGVLANTSRVDVERIDADRFPAAVGLAYAEGILAPGEMLYIPPRCWHYVRALDTSASVSFWWT